MSFPEPISSERLNVLVERLKGGTITHDEQEEIFNGHLRLIASIVWRNFNGPNVEEVFQQAAFILWKAIGDAKLRDNNLTGYLITTVKLECKEYYSRLLKMRVPMRSVRYYLAKGLNPSKELVVDAKQYTPEQLKEIIKIPKWYQAEVAAKAKEIELKEFKQHVRNVLFSLIQFPKIAKNPDELLRSKVTFEQGYMEIELNECLGKATDNFIERAIINYRKEGMSYKQIGAEVGLSTSRVGELMAKIEERFNNLYK